MTMTSAADDPQEEQAQRFLSLLDPNAKSWTFQTFDDDKSKKRRKLIKVLHGSLDQHRATLKALNERGAGIFVTVNETDGAGREAKNIVRVRAHYIDLDGAPLERVMQGKPPPHVVVETSPGRWHCYWLVQDVTLQSFTGMQKALIARYGSDPSVHDLPRVMRLPGFFHRKGAPRLPRIVHVRAGAPYVGKDFPLATLHVISPEVAAAAARYAGQGLVDDDRASDTWRALNNAALNNLAAWVPDLFAGKAVANKRGYRVTSKALGRDLEEDISITPDGIKDFGVHDVGDPRGGRRSAIGLVMEHRHDDYGAAADWLRARLGQLAPARQKTTTTAAPPTPSKPTLADLTRSAADLQRLTFADLKWIVRGYLPEGLTVLGGKPKVGKSFLALDVAIAVASGGQCLGQQCEQGDVLALFLEDNDRRLQRRMTKMLGVHKAEWPGLRYATTWPRLPDGGLDLLREWTNGVSKPRLIIVDILERVRARAKSRDTSAYSGDYDALATLHGLALEAQLSVLVIHHQRKMTADDPIETISGTLAIGGAADSIIILGSDDAGLFLYGRGRDLEEYRVIVKPNEHSRFQVVSAKPGEQASTERTQIVTALAQSGRPMQVNEIANVVEMETTVVKNLLAKLHAAGEVERVVRGTYRLPSREDDELF